MVCSHSHILPAFILRASSTYPVRDSTSIRFSQLTINPPPPPPVFPPPATPRAPPLHTIPSLNAAVEEHTAEPTAIDAAALDECTLIITVFDRYTKLPARLRWYHTVVYFKAIVVVWNAVGHTPPQIDPTDYRIPISIVRQPHNSMNNRFLPRSEITTDCVVNMDDDWDMPLALLTFSIRLWYRSYPRLLVGLLKNARSHGVGDDGSWRYLTNASMPQSIVLPSGMVYHSDYLHMYTSMVPAAARALVDETTNCDDILFNFMVANATGQPPVFVQRSGARKVHVKRRLGGRHGLWKREKHYTDRNRCVSTFADLFGGQQLRYTRDSYWAESAVEATFPSSADHHPLRASCAMCAGKAVDDCVQCS
eukprot:m.266774 g.266774  ORF g.266774 m.266774 type:complete len:365 (+) comp26769_c0_seq7:154-1248(+)